MTHSQIINTTSNMTLEELCQLNHDLVAIIKHRRSMESKDMKASLSVGDKVWFDNRGYRVNCTVTKIMRTKAIVKVDGTPQSYKITMSALNFQ
jgi:hypothetical protein